jgi:hypothetical protein
VAVIQDVIETVLTLSGVSALQAGFAAAEGSVLKYGGAISEVQRQSIAFGLAAGITAVGLKFLGESAKAAAEDEANLSRASGNFKGAFPVQELSAYTDELRVLTGVSDQTTFGLLGLLGTFQITKDQAKSLALPILNAAEALKAQGVSAEQLAVQLGKAYQTGNAQALRRVGIILDETAFSAANAEGRVRLLADALQRQGGDAAVRFRQTTLGAAQAAQSAWGEIQETIGYATQGPLKDAVNTLVRIEEGFLALPEPIKSTASLIAVGLVGAMALYAIGTGVALSRTIRLAQELAVLELAAKRTGKAMGDLTREEARQAAFGNGGGRSGVAGAVGTAAAVFGLPAIEAGMSTAPKSGVGGALAHSFGRAGEGAIIGGQIAGVPGGIGGAAIGALVAALEATFGGKKKGSGKTATEELLEKQLEEQRKTNAHLQQASTNGGAGFSARDVPTVIQRVTTRGIRV